jgi:hypothetical protein
MHGAEKPVYLQRAFHCEAHPEQEEKSANGLTVTQGFALKE